MPEISVIIPIYKVENYLSRCVDSIINQSLKDIEIILVDDGSPDSCPRLCDEYSILDNRIKVIHKKNEGLGNARNSGLDIANGQYIAFVDGDDFLPLDALELMYDASQGGKIDIVSGAVYNSWYQGCTPKVFYSFDEEKEGLGIVEALADLTASDWGDNSSNKRNLAVWGCIFKRSVIADNNIRFHSERDVIAEDIVFDYDLYLRIKSIKYIPQPVYYYCLNQQSLSRTFLPEKIDRLDILYGYLSSSPFAKQNKIIRMRQFKLYVFLSSIFHSQILQSAISCKRKRDLCFKIYNKQIWNTIPKEYDISKLPHRYQYYLDVFRGKKFLKALFRQYLYTLRRKFKK